MKRNMHRRIEALEKAAAADLKRRQKIAEAALDRLEDRHTEPFVSAFGADREGRALTGDESAARQAYRELLTQECRSNGYSSVAGFEDALPIRLAVIRALIRTEFVRSLSYSEWDLVDSAAKALEEGRDATPEEAALLQKWMAEDRRLSRLAGLDVPAEPDVEGSMTKPGSPSEPDPVVPEAKEATEDRGTQAPDTTNTPASPQPLLPSLKKDQRPNAPVSRSRRKYFTWEDWGRSSNSTAQFPPQD